MQKPEPNANSLKVTVLMHSLEGNPPNQHEWHARCNRIYDDLHRYLMGRDLEKSE